MGFENALNHTLQFEGGYADHPADRGGETFRGISRRNWPDWPGWTLIDRLKARGATTPRLINAALAGNSAMERLVSDFYRENFWRPSGAAGGPPRTTEKLFDTAVNVGFGGAVKILQRAVNALEPAWPLVVDGATGPKTRAALAEALGRAGDAEGALLREFCQEQEAHYRRIIQRDPGQKVFETGWLRRAAWLPE